VGEDRKCVRAQNSVFIVVFGPDHFGGLFYDLMLAFVVAAAGAIMAASDEVPQYTLDNYDIIPEWITGMGVLSVIG
tara:strand:- start:535 stop:762 length:228 start_codon:yes stop_codon:yes gene_type:complete